MNIEVKSLIWLAENDGLVSRMSHIDQLVPVTATRAQEITTDLIDFGCHGPEHDFEATVPARPHIVAPVVDEHRTAGLV